MLGLQLNRFRPSGNDDAFDKVVKSIINEGEIEREAFLASLNGLKPEDREAAYLFFVYTAGKTRAEEAIRSEVRRIDGTSAEIHPYSSVKIGLERGSTRTATLPTDTVIIIGHELVEDCNVPLEEVRKTLEQIVKETNSGINVKAAVEGIELLTRDRTNEYWADLERIAKHSKDGYKADLFYSSAPFAKACEALHNLKTAAHLIVHNGNPVDKNLRTVTKALMVTLMIQKVTDETEKEPSLIVVKHELAMQALEEIKYAGTGLGNDLKRFRRKQRGNFRNRKEEGKYAQYGREIKEYKTYITDYDSLRTVAETFIRPKGDYPYASTLQTLLRILSRPQPSISSAA